MNDYISTLPDDILKYIFGILCGKDRAMACIVCSAWDTLSCLVTLGAIFQAGVTFEFFIVVFIYVVYITHQK